MKRRDFLGSAAATLGAAGLSAQSAARKPNIIFILADDLGYGVLGCYGQKQIQTPNIDRLAAEGIRFTQAYSGSTVCAPSRCCLMTGKHTGRATVRGNRRPEAGVTSEETTVAVHLKRLGYQTALFGKWGLGGPGTGSVPNTRGFDHFYGYLDQVHAHMFYPEHLWDNQDEVWLKGNWFGQKKEYTPDLIHQRAMEFLNRDHKQPFFLYYPSTIPHANNELGTYKGDGMEIPSDAPYENRDWPRVEKGFAAMVAKLDRNVGEILDVLKKKGLDGDTLVVFSSDNGPHREGGHNPDFFDDNGPLRGIKRDVYEGGIRVPFIARWTGKIKPGQVSGQVLAFWDFLPTAVELAGGKPPADIDGTSMASALLRGAPVKSKEPLYWEFHEGGFKQAVRFGDWKGVRINRSPVELYNLKDDVGEKNNVAARHPDVVKKVEEMFRNSRVDSKLFPVKVV